jgi:hypothetical protein
MRYLIGLLVTVGLIVLVLVLLFRGGGSTPPTAAGLVDLSKYANTDSSAQLIIDGPEVADQSHQQVEIDVSSSDVTFTLYNGYQQNAVRTQTTANNTVAYGVFLQALQHQNFTKGNTDPKLKDERGYCPLGQRNIYSFNNDSKQLMRFWSTNCGVSTFKGTAGTVTLLFKQQVPNYNAILRDIPGAGNFSL